MQLRPCIVCEMSCQQVHRGAHYLSMGGPAPSHRPRHRCCWWSLQPMNSVVLTAATCTTCTLPGASCHPPCPPLLPPNPSVNAWTTRRGNTSCRYPRKGLAAYCRTSPMLAKGKGTRLRSQAVREPRLGVHPSFWPTSRTDAIGGSFGGKRTGGDWGCPARLCLRGINKRP